MVEGYIYICICNICICGTSFPLYYYTIDLSSRGGGV